MVASNTKTTTLIIKSNINNPNYTLLILNDYNIVQCIDEIIKSLCNILNIEKNQIKKINVFDKNYVNILNFLSIEDFDSYVENNINYALLHYDVEFVNLFEINEIEM